MKGLIAAALGGLSKGVGQVATAQMEVNARKALLEAEEEMRARLAEAAEARAEARQIAAEDRGIANIPRAAEATAAAEEGIMERRFGPGSTYSGLLSAQMSASETPSQRAVREASEYELQAKRDRDELVRQLATETDPAKQQVLRQQLIASGVDFKTPELDPTKKMALESAYKQREKLVDAYYKAVGEGNEDAASRMKTDLGDLDSTIAQLSGQAPLAPDEETINAFLQDAAKIFNDPSATDAQRNDALRTGVSLGAFSSEDEGRQRLTPAAASAPAAAAAPKADLRTFEGYDVPAQSLGSAVGRGTEYASGLLSQGIEKLGASDPAALARAEKVQQEAAANSVAREMAAGRLPSVATSGDRQRVEVALASGLLPPEYAETLKRYLEETAK